MCMEGSRERDVVGLEFCGSSGNQKEEKTIKRNSATTCARIQFGKERESSQMDVSERARGGNRLEVP